MADDQTQRPYRSNPTQVRSAPSAAPRTPSGNDPLAELARLIGQNDPFAEYGRQNAAQRALPQAPQLAPEWSAQPAAGNAQPGAGQGYVQPPAAPPRAAQAAPYAAPPYAPPHYDAPDEPAYGNYQPQFAGVSEAAYEHHDAYYPNDPSPDAEHQDFYDDVPPRRRMAVLAVAAVFALAVIGTAGAFGYRALFGSSPSGPPPIIKADTSPSKIVPAAKSKDAKNSKLIYDRVAGNSQDEKLVSREEQPVDINNKPAGVVLPQDQNGMPSGSIQPALGSGVVGVEPRKIHTITIRPDGTVMADAAPNAPPPAAPPAPAAPVASSAPPPAPRHTVAQTEQKARTAQPVHREPTRPAPSNVPLSLSPNAPAPVHSPARPMRTATAAPTQLTPTRAAPASGSGGYAVQLASRHSEADAQASFHSLQAKYPQQLGGRQPLIRRVDLGAKGIYYRAMVGPFGSSEEASRVCSSLKAAGGSCFVQRI
jgi:hypothetical protein